MNKTMLKMTSHPMNENQKKDATLKYGIEKFKTISEDLQKRFSQVPPDGELDSEMLNSFKKEISKLNKGDVLFISGEFGVTYNLVNFGKKNGIIAVYATTRRESSEEILPDGTVKKRPLFKHVQFREYK